MNRLIIHGGGNDFAGSVGREYEERHSKCVKDERDASVMWIY